MDSEGTLGRGHANGGRGLRRQRSLEWRERRGYGASAQSSSDDEDNARHAVGPSSSAARGARSPGQMFASILAQQYGSKFSSHRVESKFARKREKKSRARIEIISLSAGLRPRSDEKERYRLSVYYQSDCAA